MKSPRSTSSLGKKTSARPRSKLCAKGMPSPARLSHLYRLSGNRTPGAIPSSLSDGIGCDGYVCKYLERALAPIADRPWLPRHGRTRSRGIGATCRWPILANDLASVRTQPASPSGPRRVTHGRSGLSRGVSAATVTACGGSSSCAGRTESAPHTSAGSGPSRRSCLCSRSP